MNCYRCGGPERTGDDGYAYCSMCGSCLGLPSTNPEETCAVCAANLRVLDLQPPATVKDIKIAYRDLSKVWHPDRFQGDPRLSAKAEEQFKRVQSAFQGLLTHIPIHERAGEQTSESSSSHSPTSEDEDRTYSIRRLLADFHDNQRFFVEPCIPTYLVQQVQSVYRDSSSVLVAAVDTSMTRSGRTFIAFLPKTIVLKDTGLIAAIDLIDYSALNAENVLLVHGPCIPPSIFDRMAENIGLGKPYEGSSLYVEIAGKKVSDMLDNDGCRRLHALLMALCSAVVPSNSTFSKSRR